MEFTCRIDMDSAAFHAGERDNEECDELSRILSRLSRDVYWERQGEIRDINGNTVGRWEIKGE